MSVRIEPDPAFRLFTEDMGKWWPVEAYSRVVNEFANEHVQVTRLEFQAHLGGLILEHVSDGRVLPWGEVAGWDPPRRVVMAWHPHSQPEPPTEIEVTFSARVAGTVVDLEHRGWERLSESFREAMYDVYVRGWTTTLELFATAANGKGDSS